MHISNRVQNHTHPGVDRAVNRESARLSAAHPQILGDISAIKNSLEALVGKTIDPRFATMTMSHINYDGHGRILSFKYLLSPEQYRQLTANIIPDLAKTPAQAETAIRTPQECLIKLATLIAKSDLPDFSRQKILLEIKDAFLAGNIKKASIKTLFNSMQPLLSGNLGLQNQVKETVASLEKKFHITKHNDNYYGRTFETELAEIIVNSPSAETINNTEIIKSTILHDFKSLSREQKREFCEKIHKGMLGDPATWRADIKEVKAFLQHKSAVNFIRMINSDSKFKHLLIMHLSMKYMLFSPGYDELNINASKLYESVIKPQRKLVKTLDTDIIKSSRTGIQLHYQIRSQQAQKTTGIRPVDRYRLLVKDLTKHNRLALNAEKPMGIGMSGSSNILNSLFASIHKNNKGFNMDHARLFTAAFLTHSGGHSFNEAYTVFNYEKNHSFASLTYDSLSKQNNYANHVVNAAYEKLLATAMEL